MKSRRKPRTRSHSVNEAVHQEHLSSRSGSEDDSGYIGNSGCQLEFITKTLTPSPEHPMIVENLPELESHESPSSVVEPVNETSLDKTGILPFGLDLEKETLPHIRLKENATDTQKDDDVEEHIPEINPVEADSVREGETVEVETCRKECAREIEVPEVLPPISGNVLEFSGLLDTVTEGTQPNGMSSSAQAITSDHPVLDEDLGAIDPRCSKRHCGPPNKLQYYKLGNPLTLVIQSLLQGLSSALTTSLEESTYISDMNMSDIFPTVVTSQPPAGPRTCLNSEGECVTQVTNECWQGQTELQIK